MEKVNGNLYRYDVIEDYKGLIEKLVKSECLGEILINGKPVLTVSDRYRNFYTHGYKCCNCGLEVSFAAVEKPLNQNKFHINLYGVKEDGKQVLFTKDHIYPRSKGGFDDLVNYQVMCEKCNSKKLDKTEMTSEQAIKLGYTSKERVEAYEKMVREIKIFEEKQKELKRQEQITNAARMAFKKLVPKRHKLGVYA